MCLSVCLSHPGIVPYDNAARYGLMKFSDKQLHIFNREENYGCSSFPLSFFLMGNL